MPTTRKKTIKTVYKDEESEGETGDFSDSGSEAKISDASSSEEEIIEDEEEIIAEADESSGDDFRNKTKQRRKANKPPIQRRKPKFAKDLVNKINKQVIAEGDEDIHVPNSSDDESQSVSTKKKPTATLTSIHEHNSDSDNDDKIVYRDTFMELENHNMEIERTKASIQSYVSKTQAAIQINVSKNNVGREFDVNDLLAQGEEVIEQKIPSKKKVKAKKRRDDSESEAEDWEEVNEAKSIPQQGLQLFVEFPDAVRKSKKVDVEMMMKRKINRVKKEYQVYMHKVHVLCWIGHGNYVSRVLNDQEVMAAALAMVPKGCYPEERLTTKYVEQITTWYKDKLTLKQDKHEHKFRPKAPPLKNTILSQIKSRVTTAKKYNIFIFVAMLRALGLQCRVMFNFTAVPIRPPSSELCSLSMKSKDDSNLAAGKKSGDKNNLKASKDDKSAENVSENNAEKNKLKATAKSKSKCIKKIAQVDGIDDTFIESESEYENIMQLDGNDDTQPKTRSTRTRAKKAEASTDKTLIKEGVSSPKRAKTNPKGISANNKSKASKENTGAIKDKPLAPQSDEIPEAPKSPLRKRTVRNKDPKETSQPPEKDVKATNDITDKLETAPKSGHRNRSVRNKDGTANSNAANTKRDTSKSPLLYAKAANGLSDMTPQEAPKTPLRRRTAGNNEGTSKKTSATTKPETSKSSQTKRNSAVDKNNKSLHINKNGVVKDSITLSSNITSNDDGAKLKGSVNSTSPCKMTTRKQSAKTNKFDANKEANAPKTELPTVILTDENLENVESKFFSEATEPIGINRSRKRSHTTLNVGQNTDDGSKNTRTQIRTKSAGAAVERSKYFDSQQTVTKKPKLNTRQTKKEQIQEDKLRVSHKDLRQKAKPKNDVTEDLVDIIKSRIKSEKVESKKGIVKEEPISLEDSDDDFKPTKITPRAPKISPKPSKLILKPGTSKRLDRRVLSSDDDGVNHNKLDVWCEVFVEELEQWIAVDVIKGKVHCTSDLYVNLTRRYVPHWNTVTRKQRAEPEWWKTALQPWLGPKTARDREEDEYLDRMQLEAPLPKNYEPPTAENGIVPRNAYGNVELFKQCMLPKKTVHIKLPGLNKVAKKLSIDCAPAMTGFDFNGGFSHPVYDGEIEKMELRVYGNWRRLIRGLMIRERLKLKYGFQEPTTSQAKPNKGPRLLVKK
ncbi:Nucleotide excision repair protein [Operophtera brumata]|uniref:Nucleotide excision repair protein n=1 Tax=Operophtera brumata TaxID=104452 RepID=A0A0L7LTI4_OPEBR|nr:Nucleotide excision repair protein [Operophtera brumata]